MNITSSQVIFLILTFFASALIALAATPLVRAIAISAGAIDKPDPRRVNKKPIPRMGGLAIYYGFLVAVICFGDIGSLETRGILLGTLVIVLTGCLDDIYGLKPVVKLLGQILAAVIVALHGITIDVLTNPNPFSSVDYLALGHFSIPVTVVWIVLVTNAVNLIDGLDGLAVGVSSIACIALFIVAIFTGENAVALIIVAVIGACLGFLPYNSHPAKIFMGDTGALFLGFIMSTVSIQGLFKGYAIISFAVPLLILGLPIFDTSMTILRRLKNKQGVMTADRGHLHHKLLDMGFSHKQTVFILYTISAISALIAVVLALTGPIRAMLLILLVMLFVVLTGAFWGKGFFKSIRIMGKAAADEEDIEDVLEEIDEIAEDEDKETKNE